MIDDETGEPISYLINTLNNQNFTINPEGDLPEFSNILVIFNNIQDINGNFFSVDTIQFRTADESPPLISGSGLANTNQYCYIDFNEGVFSNNSGDGGIELEDLEYTFESNGGNCTEIEVLEIKNYTGAVLTGGETLIYAYLQLNGSPSGSETIMFAPADGISIFDQSGNPMHPSTITDTLTLNASASIDSIYLDPSNEYLDIIFSNGIYGDSQQLQTIQIDDIQILFISNNGNASTANINGLSNNTGNSLIGGENIVRIQLEFDALPSGVETIRIMPSGEDRIFNSYGVLVPQSENTGNIFLNDQLPPSGVTDAEDGAFNVYKTDTLSMVFTDNLYDPDTGDLMTISELKNFVTLEYVDSSNTAIPFDLIMEGSPPTLFIVPETDYASDGVVYFDFTASLADENGNAIDFNFSATFTIEDYIPPKVDTYLLALDNSYIDLEFDDHIYGNDNASGTMDINGISVKIIPNGSEMDSCTVTSLTRTDSNFLTGGEVSIRVNLEYNNTPNGNEFILLESSENISIYDESGNEYSEVAYIDTTRLNDILPPSIDSISVPIDSFIVLMESTPITFGFNEKVDSLDFTISSKAIDSVQYEFNKEDSLLRVILQPPFASHDSITVNFSYLEDEAGLSTVDIAYTYITPILGDYNLDTKITHDDLYNLVENWERKNFNYELGPVSGEAPHFISTPDSKFDIEDGIAFVQIWSWYQEEYGQIIEDTVMIGRPLEFTKSEDELYLFIDNSITSGQIQVRDNKSNIAVKFLTVSEQKGSMFLNYQNIDKGFTIMEFARSTNLQKDTIKIPLLENTEISIFYNFSDESRKDIQKGYFTFEHSPNPTSFALYPAYPNPFNPTTTLHFDIPELDIIKKTYLSVFDVRGREVDLLINEIKSPGSYKLKWNGENFSSGVYFVNMRIGNHVKTKKIILLK